jgi:hypothetical protein
MRLDTTGAPILTKKFHLAQAAEESSALIAWNDGAFARMIVAAGLAFSDQCRRTSESIDF